MTEALCDPGNRGGAYFRWVADQEGFLARSVATATAFIGLSYTPKPRKQNPRQTGAFQAPGWAARVLYEHVRDNPEASIRSMRVLPAFSEVRYRNWFVDKLLAWCIDRKLLVRNPQQGRKVTHSVLPLPALQCIHRGQQVLVEALTALDAAFGARMARKARQKAARREFDAIVAPYLAEQKRIHAKSLRRWFAKQKQAPPKPTKMAPESIRAELASLQSELEALRGSWVQELITLGDHDSLNPAMGQVSAKIDQITDFCSEYGLALHPAELKADTPTSFDPTVYASGSHFEQYTDLDPALVADITSRMA
jgi:hypothetical protein